MLLKWTATLPDAIPPHKAHATDSGFDLHLIRKVKVENGIHFYDTGVAVEPPEGFYTELVGRSSISKSGWTLANSVGIIDYTYRKSILVALARLVPDAPEITLPARLVQIIPKQLHSPTLVQCESLDETGRGSFGSTG